MPLSGAFHSANSSRQGREDKKATITPTTIICSLIVCATLVISAVVIALVAKRQKQQVLRLEEDAKSSLEEDWEVKPEDVTIGEELGKGNFGTVYKGTLNDSKKVF